MHRNAFDAVVQEAGKSRNPTTGESIKFPTRKRVKFKAYSELKETVG